ncbi:MAG TPA: lycopene cyclase family protein [Flavisolibacter sp.]|jgi:lycopene beta-cyclase|nr:lycopene cyclase family protein [Flavisolibacter sp.]
MQQNHFDYIIAGTGCAGLSLAMHLVQQKTLQAKTILLVDEALKIHNDRTWCFWEKEAGLFEDVVCKQWDKLWFHSKTYSEALSIAPYRYKMIRGIDFYQYCQNSLQQYPNVSFLHGKVESVFSGNKTGVMVNGKEYTAQYVFNSIPPKNPLLGKKDVWLLQHFKGWTIETNKAVFNPAEATLMDFRVTQKRGTTFCYVLPTTPNKALIEYTLFTPSLLKPEEYDEELKAYIREYLQLEDYQVTESEFGIIPMTNYRFSQGENNIINIGTAGGQTKGSSGYTFYFIQQHSQKIVTQLVNGKHPRVDNSPKRFHFYDSVLLEVLRQNSVEGAAIFSRLFKKNKPQPVLAFLNNASSLPTEARIISTLPTLPFLKAAIRQIF